MGDKLRASGMFGDAFVRNGYTISREGSDEYVAFVSGDAPQSHALTEKMVLAYNVHDALVAACNHFRRVFPGPQAAFTFHGIAGVALWKEIDAALALAKERP